MSTNFPTSLDSLTNPTGSDTMNGVSHSSQHANLNDAVEALQAKVGINGSAVTTSHDYKLAALSSTSDVEHNSMAVGDGTSTAPSHTFKNNAEIGAYYSSGGGNLLQPAYIIVDASIGGGYSVPIVNANAYGHSFSNTEGVFVFNMFDDDTVLHEAAWGFEVTDSSFELGWLTPDDVSWNINETAWYVDFDPGTTEVNSQEWTTVTAGMILNYSFNGVASLYVSDAKLVLDHTITTAGTTGNRTINKPTGTVNMAAGANTLTVTNSFCKTTSLVFPVIRTNDTTAVIKNVVPSNGSFVINLTANATAETSIGFMVVN